MTSDQVAGGGVRPGAAAPTPPGSAGRTLGRGLARLVQLAGRWLLRLALPLLCAAAVLQGFPYHATVQGVPFEVQATLLHRTTLSADTTLGSWEFPDFIGLPVGVHITPEDVDVLQLTRLAGGDTAAFVQRLQSDVAAQVPQIAGWLIGEFLVGLAIGLAVTAAISMSLRYLRGLTRRPHELRVRALQFGAAALVTVAVGGYGVLTYDPGWVRNSRLTGTLAAAQLFPGQLQAYYGQQSKAFDVLGSVIGIQAALQQQIEDAAPATAVQIMFISDMHLAANYGLVAKYASSYDVDLIVDTGDEAEFGTAEELTPAYLDALRAVTAATPMLWLAGNHDSPAVVDVLRGIPGVTVLGTKTATAEGYAVTAGVVRAFGLTIAGLPDPRVYGGRGAYGADARDVTDPLERAAVARAVGEGSRGAPSSTAPAVPTLTEPGLPDPSVTEPGLPDPGLTEPTVGEPGTGAASSAPAAATGVGPVDLFATHEPVAAGALRTALPGQIRETVSGHVHAQNATDEIRDGADLDLVEGSTGAGGLDNIVRGSRRPPIEFSIESVGADCQFTRVVRFSIAPAPTDAGQVPTPAPADTSDPGAYGDDVTATTVYFRPQQLAPDRACGVQLGLGPQEPWPT